MNYYYFLFYFLQLFVSFQVIDNSFIKFKGYQIIPLSDLNGYEIPPNIHSIYSIYRGFPLVQIWNLKSAAHSNVAILVDLDKTQFNILFTLCAFFYFIGGVNVLRFASFSTLIFLIFKGGFYKFNGSNQMQQDQHQQQHQHHGGKKE